MLTVCRVKGEVELTPEEGTIVGVDQLKHALVDDVRLKAEQYEYELRKKKNPHGGSQLTHLAVLRKLY